MCDWGVYAYLAALFLDRESGGDPAPPAAVHGNHPLVTHFLKIVGDQCGAITTTAIEENLRLPVRDVAFDVALDDPPGKVFRPGDVPGGPFVILADIDEVEFFLRVQPFL